MRKPRAQKYFAKPRKQEEPGFKSECVMHFLPPHCSNINGAGQEKMKRNSIYNPVDPDPTMNPV